MSYLSECIIADIRYNLVVVVGGTIKIPPHQKITAELNWN